MIKRTLFLLALQLAALLVSFTGTYGEEEAHPGPQPSPSSNDEIKRFEVVFEPEAYYTALDLIVSLTDQPIPHMGEKKEIEIYRTLLSGAALLPRYFVLEGSVNPMPNLGVYIRKNHEDFYNSAEISGSFNWIRALTAGFEEPYALSLLAGNVLSFDVPGTTDIKGMGYSGYLYSAGIYHIKDNVLIRDRWREIEWKMKGDRKSPIKKLSWSFRIGAKFHSHPDIADITYLSFRRSRLDYVVEEASALNNSGFEYTVDFDLGTLRALRHYFFIEKKWPSATRKMAFTLALGFISESAGKYTGSLATPGRGGTYEVILRPNLEF